MKTLLLLALILPTTLFADSQFAVLYTAANPDYSPFDDGHGFSIKAEYDFDNGLFLTGFYNGTDFRASGPEVGNLHIDSWLETGIGYSFDHRWGTFYSLITFEKITADSQTLEGFGAHFGYRKDFSQDWNAILQFGHIDTEFHDYQLELMVNYKLADNFSITVGLRDYADWDYTSYEAGFIYRF